MCMYMCIYIYIYEYIHLYVCIYIYTCSTSTHINVGTLEIETLIQDSVLCLLTQHAAIVGNVLH